MAVLLAGRAGRAWVLDEVLDEALVDVLVVLADARGGACGGVWRAASSSGDIFSRHAGHMEHRSETKAAFRSMSPGRMSCPHRSQ
jgi:hypothetical protein